MATKQFTAIRDFRYGTRMLRAGDPVEMDASNARLYTALGAISSPAAPKKAAAPAAPAPKPKAAPRKRAAKKK